MAVVGVESDAVAACGVRFRGFPAESPEAAVAGPERVRAAVSGFASAWGRADELVVGDEGDFAARIGRAAALYAEADLAVAAACRREAA